ncbi:hypothetical protein PMAYCL1PPCAC_00112, partial [Pristionchus mayeri]
SARAGTSHYTLHTTPRHFSNEIFWRVYTRADIVREHPGGDQQEVVLLRDLDSIVRKRNCAICKSPLSKEELIEKKRKSLKTTDFSIPHVHPLVTQPYHGEDCM